ncbi:hypothetical protein [Alteribacter aurantiacus]|uniref:hypothetical protein n=1 Tax=Alteribacter aurantiacus TaxID=254410 RepID=UPI000407D165|nr:hypothetical protein [Alteribacter aurantiacus]
MDITPVNARKKRTTKLEANDIKQAAVKINKSLQNVFSDLQALKDHLDLIEKKYTK